MTDDLNALADRCEAATGPDRELDCRIWAALEGVTDFDLYRQVVPDLGQWQAAYFTASLDAALTLVPEGCVWTVLTDYDLPGRARIYGWPLPHENAAPLLRQADAATPALALCAAALRARAQQEGQR